MRKNAPNKTQCRFGNQQCQTCEKQDDCGRKQWDTFTQPIGHHYGPYTTQHPNFDNAVRINEDR